MIISEENCKLCVTFQQTVTYIYSFLHVRRPFINALGCDPTWSKRGVTTCKEKFNAVFFHMYNWKGTLGKDNKKFPGPQGNEECGYFTYTQGSTKILGGPNLDGLTGGCYGGGPWGGINWIAGRPYKGNDIHNNGRNIYPNIYGAYVFFSHHILYSSLFNCSPRTRI